MKPEDQNDAVSRRSFLKISAIWAGGAWIVGYPVARTTNQVVNGAPGRIPAQETEYRILTSREAAIMDALADCIIPPGDYAGGRDAGITRFVDRQLGEYLHRDKAMYKTCLTALNNGSRDDYGHDFIELDEESQVRYLTDIEAGVYNNQSGNWGDYTPSSFFNTMRHHCMMGFYGHPRHGGNRDWVSYQMLGLPVEQIPWNR